MATEVAALDLTFGEALEALKKGKRVRRRAWPTSQYVFLAFGKHPIVREPYIALHTQSGHESLWVVQWTPDLLEVDWMVVS